MIKLLRTYTKEENDIFYFLSDVSINDVETQIWFSTHKENSEFISESNGDSFILFLFVYAAFNSLKFESEVPISKRLKYGLLEILLPIFQKMKIQTNKNDFVFKKIDDTKFVDASASATSMSFGIDSFHTYLIQKDSDYKIDFITLFNAGAFGQNGGDKTRTLFKKMQENVKSFAQRNNLKFLWVDTNLNEILRMPFVKTHTFRNFACALLFQKTIKSYYYASGITLDKFRLNVNDTAYYDLAIAKAIAGNTMEFYISGMNDSRLDKTIIVSNDPLTFDELNVCLVTSDNENLNSGKKIKNCSKCFKCIRTMITLDVLGKLEDYINVFDLDIYNKNKSRYWAEIIYLRYRANNIFSIDIRNQAKINKYKIPFMTYPYLIIRFLKPIFRKN